MGMKNEWRGDYSFTVICKYSLSRTSLQMTSAKSIVALEWSPISALESLCIKWNSNNPYFIGFLWELNWIIMKITGNISFRKYLAHYKYKLKLLLMITTIIIIIICEETSKRMWISPECWGKWFSIH